MDFLRGLWTAFTRPVLVALSPTASPGCSQWAIGWVRFRNDNWFLLFKLRPILFVILIIVAIILIVLERSGALGNPNARYFQLVDFTLMWRTQDAGVCYRSAGWGCGRRNFS